MKLLLFLGSASLLFFSACVNHEREEPIPITPSVCDVTPATYSANVSPIIQQNCAIPGCHVAGFPDGDLTTYEALKEKVDEGTFKNSVIDAHAPIMPPTGKLPEDQIKILQCWLNNGALKN